MYFRAMYFRAKRMSDMSFTGNEKVL